MCVLKASVPEYPAFVVGHNLHTTDFHIVDAVRIQQDILYLRLEQYAYVYFGLFHTYLSVILHYYLKFPSSWEEGCPLGWGGRRIIVFFII